MFGFRIRVRSAAIVLTAVFALSAVTSLEAQSASTPRRRRETNANRKARVERNIQATYSHQWEVAGGGGYLRFRSGNYLQKNNEVTFFLNSTYWMSPRFGITGQASGGFGSAKIGNTIYNIQNPQISQYYLTAGPSYRVYAKERYAITAYGLVGAGIGKFDSGSKGIPAANLGMWDSTTRAAFQVGFNADYNLYHNFAARVTPYYMGTTWNGGVHNNVGVNVGIVYRFGQIH